MSTDAQGARLHQAFRFALDPARTQRRALAAHCGAARFAFNWGLEQVQASLALREFELCMFGEVRSESLGWSLPELRREWNRSKELVAPWWGEHSKEAYSSGLAALAAALRGWRASRSGERAGAAVGFPRFRKRGRRDSCRFTTGPVRVDDPRHITLPRIGRLRTAEATVALQRRLTAGTARILAATIARDADRWFVAFTCEVDGAVVADNGRRDTVGVDLGVHTLAALSTGELVPSVRPLRREERRTRRLQRTVGRRRKGSARRRRAVGHLARAHRRVASVRRHHLHVLTTRLAQSHGRIVVEDLNVRGMIRSARGTLSQPRRRVRARAGQNRAVLECGFAELRRLLDYKCRWYGSTLVVADRWFPSSRRCSGCGTVRGDLPRRERVFRCGRCSLELDRDLNAARNLVRWAEAHDVAASAVETQNARGEAAAIRPPAGERLEEARTGPGPEPEGITTRGRHRSGLPNVR
ncbi:MAG: IS607 family element transposase accessory protein TnpB [Candidatus Dormibacteraeota bacterium]|nr:IS607 family element transposase accessory protein TnpB [Candidatus Dormibacteraeota bacterium]